MRGLVQALNEIGILDRARSAGTPAGQRHRRPCCRAAYLRGRVPRRRLGLGPRATPRARTATIEAPISSPRSAAKRDFHSRSMIAGTWRPTPKTGRRSRGCSRFSARTRPPAVGGARSWPRQRPARTGCQRRPRQHRPHEPSRGRRSSGQSNADRGRRAPRAPSAEFVRSAAALRTGCLTARGLVGRLRPPATKGAAHRRLVKLQKPRSVSSPRAMSSNRTSAQPGTARMTCREGGSLDG